MPFASKAQQRFMFARHPELAKEFAEGTDFASLPERVGGGDRERKASMAAKKKTAKKVAKKAAKKTTKKTAKKTGKKTAKKTAKKVGKRKSHTQAALERAQREVKLKAEAYGPSISDEQLDRAERLYKARLRRQYDKAYPKNVVSGAKGPPRKRKAAKAQESVTAADIINGLVTTAAPPKAGARRRGRRAQKVVVAYICGGPRLSGCGGGKKGSHVIARLK